MAETEEASGGAEEPALVRWSVSLSMALTFTTRAKLSGRETLAPNISKCKSFGANCIYGSNYVKA